MAFFDCSFSKIKLYELSSTYTFHTKDNAKQIFINYNDCFKSFSQMVIPEQNLKTKLKFHKLNEKRKNICSRLSNRNENDIKGFPREVYIKTFSSEEWQKLPESKKHTHTISDCRGCFIDLNTLHCSFPWKKTQTKNNPILDSSVFNHHSTPSTEKETQNLAASVLQNVEEKFFEQTGQSFCKMLPNVKQAGLTTKMSKKEKESCKLNMQRKLKAEIQGHLHQTDVERPYRERESLSSYERKIRNEVLVNTNNPTKLAKKRPHGDTQINFNLHDCREALNALPDNALVNWSETARSYGINKPNGGQILKEQLDKVGISTNRFKSVQKRKKNVLYERRVRKKFSGGKISFPVHLTKMQVKKEMSQLIKKGSYNIGEPCCTRTVKRRVLQKDGTLVESSTPINGRVIPLRIVRQNMLKHHENLGLLRTNLAASKVTRHLALWSDHSSFQNRGYMLYEVSAIYDSNLYLTSAEYLKIFNKDLNVVSEVERPVIYILAQIDDTFHQQKLLNSARLKDLKDLDIPLKTSSGLEVEDVLRFQKGDHPQLQTEFGVSIGGDTCCVTCESSKTSYSDLTYVWRQPIRQVSSMQKMCVEGIFTKIPGERRPLHTLKKAELSKELKKRGKNNIGNVPDLKARLKDCRKGVEAVPLVVSDHPNILLETVGLHHIEPAPFDPLHTTKGHIVNVLSELKVHPQYGAEIKDFESAIFHGKTILRGRDYREALQKLCLYIKTKGYEENVLLLVNSLWEIVQYLYMSPIHRSTSIILRITNLVLVHHVMCKLVFPEIKSMRRSKFYGQYYHDLSHISILYRIISPSSLHCELEEADFHHCKDISQKTSGHTPENIISNIMLRSQVEGIHKQTQGHDDNKVKSTIGDLVFKNDWLKKYPNLMQAHAESIADYLLCGRGVWWDKDSDGNIIYKESSSKYPEMHNFTSSTLHEEQGYLIENWKKLSKKVKLKEIEVPIQKVKFFDSDGELTETIRLEVENQSNCESKKQHTKRHTDQRQVSQNSEQP